jgi:hypothetical protein
LPRRPPRRRVCARRTAGRAAGQNTTNDLSQINDVIAAMKLLSQINDVIAVMKLQLAAG